MSWNQTCVFLFEPFGLSVADFFLGDRRRWRTSTKNEEVDADSPACDMYSRYHTPDIMLSALIRPLFGSRQAMAQKLVELQDDDWH